ncbi:MAG: hypothetical protein ABR500_00500 [Dermatophilaceae bacterium]|nr:hypothetical protein [Intrasporangiaceae bacterium]
MTSSTPTRSSTPIRIIALGVIASLVLFLAAGFFAGNANASSHKVWVCKYVSKPGEDEVLKAGKNPISVGMQATVGDFFQDGQELSYVIAVDAGGQTPTCPATPPEHEEELPPSPPITPDDDEKDNGDDTTSDKKPVAAPTDLGSSQTAGLFSLFAIAAGLLGAAAFALRGARN